MRHDQGAIPVGIDAVPVEPDRLLIVSQRFAELSLAMKRESAVEQRKTEIRLDFERRIEIADRIIVPIEICIGPSTPAVGRARSEAAVGAGAQRLSRNCRSKVAGENQRIPLLERFSAANFAQNEADILRNPKTESAETEQRDKSDADPHRPGYHEQTQTSCDDRFIRPANRRPESRNLGLCVPRSVAGFWAAHLKSD